MIHEAMILINKNDIENFNQKIKNNISVIKNFKIKNDKIGSSIKLCVNGEYIIIPSIDSYTLQLIDADFYELALVPEDDQIYQIRIEIASSG